MWRAGQGVVAGQGGRRAAAGRAGGVCGARTSAQVMRASSTRRFFESTLRSSARTLGPKKREKRGARSFHTRYGVLGEKKVMPIS